MSDPLAVLPSKVVLNIFERLPSLRVWQLRRVAILWNAMLSDARFEIVATNDFEHPDPSDHEARIELLKTHHQGKPAGLVRRDGAGDASIHTVQQNHVRYPVLVKHFTAYSLSNGQVKIHNLQTGEKWTKESNSDWAPRMTLTNRIIAFIGREYPGGPQMLFWSKLDMLYEPMQQWRPVATLESLARNGDRIALTANSNDFDRLVQLEDDDYLASLLRQTETRTGVTILVYNTPSFDEPEYSFVWNHPITYTEPMIILDRNFITVMTLSYKGRRTQCLESYTAHFTKRTIMQETTTQELKLIITAPEGREQLLAAHIHKIGDGMHYHIMFFDSRSYIEDQIIKVDGSGAQFVSRGLMGPRAALWRQRYYQLKGNRDKIESETAVALDVDEHKLGARLARTEHMGSMQADSYFGRHMRFCLASDWYLVALGPIRRYVEDEVQALTFLRTRLRLGDAVTFDLVHDHGQSRWRLASASWDPPTMPAVPDASVGLGPVLEYIRASIDHS